MAVGILVALFVLLGWSVERRIDSEEFYAVFGTILLMVLMLEVAISGIGLAVRGNHYYLRSIGHFFVHRIFSGRNAIGVTPFQRWSFSLYNRIYFSLMRRQYCRRISISGQVIPAFPGLLFGNLPRGAGLNEWPTTIPTLPKRKKHLQRVYPNGLLGDYQIVPLNFQ